MIILNFSVVFRYVVCQKRLFEVVMQFSSSCVPSFRMYDYLLWYCNPCHILWAMHWSRNIFPDYHELVVFSSSLSKYSYAKGLKGCLCLQESLLHLLLHGVSCWLPFSSLVFIIWLLLAFLGWEFGPWLKARSLMVLLISLLSTCWTFTGCRLSLMWDASTSM